MHNSINLLHLAICSNDNNDDRTQSSDCIYGSQYMQRHPAAAVPLTNVQCVDSMPSAVRAVHCFDKIADIVLVDVFAGERRAASTTSRLIYLVVFEMNFMSHRFRHSVEMLRSFHLSSKPTHPLSLSLPHRACIAIGGAIVVKFKSNCNIKQNETRIKSFQFSSKMLSCLPIY